MEGEEGEGHELSSALGHSMWDRTNDNVFHRTNQATHENHETTVLLESSKSVLR